MLLSSSSSSVSVSRYGTSATDAAAVNNNVADVFVIVFVAHGIFAAIRDAPPPPPPADVVHVVVLLVDDVAAAVAVTVDGDGGGCSRPRVLAGFHGRRARTPLAHTAAAVHSPRPRSTRRRCCRRRRHRRRHAPTSAPPRQLASQP